MWSWIGTGKSEHELKLLVRNLQNYNYKRECVPGKNKQEFSYEDIMSGIRIRSRA